MENPRDSLEKGGPSLELRANSFRALGRVRNQFLHPKNGLHSFVLKLLREVGLGTGDTVGKRPGPCLCGSYILDKSTLTNKETSRFRNNNNKTSRGWKDKLGDWD